jgi:translocation and assembly module TamB
MTKRSRLWIIILSSLAGLVVALLLAVLIITQTSWFQNFVREKIASATEDAIGGKVEIGSFALDWRTLRVSIRNFVIHGTEPAGSAPLLRVDALDLQLKLFSTLKNVVDLQYLGITHPAANVIVFKDGTTNIPQPKTVSKPSNKSGLQTVVDLAVKQFVLKDGTLQFAQQSIPLNVQGQNLRVGLTYDRRSPAYEGRLSLDPIYAKTGAGTPLTAHLDVPVRIEGDAIRVSNGSLTTPDSRITISAQLNHLAAPIIDARASAHLSLPELEAAWNPSLVAQAKNAPAAADAEVALHMDDQRIEISNTRLTLGQTTLEAAGLLKDPAHRNNLHFNGQLVLDQLAKLANLSVEPSGTITLAGNASFSSSADYLVAGHIQTQNVQVKTGPNQIGPLGLSTQFRADPHVVSVNGLRFTALGGELLARAELREFQQLAVNGRLANFQLRNVMRGLGSKPLGYDTTLSGTLNAQDDLKATGTTGLAANALLSLAGGNRGVPVNGRITAQYSGKTDTASLGNSYVALPHSRLDLTGVLGNHLSLKLLSSNLSDFAPALQSSGSSAPQPMPVALQGGTATVTADVLGALRSPQITGNVLVTNFVTQDRKFDRLSADLQASASGARILNGLLQRSSLQAHFDGSVGLRQWSSTPKSPVAVNASIRNADLSDIMVLAGQPAQQGTGSLNLSAQIGGTVGNPSGTANLALQNGTLYQEHFDRIGAALTFADQLVTLKPVEVVAGDARLAASGVYTHPRDTMGAGHLQFTVATNTISLAQFKNVEAQHPDLNGTVMLNANLAADVIKSGDTSQVAVRTVEANLAANDLRDKKASYGNLTAAAHTVGDTVNYTVDSNLASSSTTVRGSTRLAANYPTSLDARIESLNVERVLALAGQSSLPVQGGTLNANAHLEGAINNPTGNLSLNLANAVVYQEPLTEFSMQGSYAADSVTIPALRLSAPAGDIRLNGSLQHPAGDFNHGKLTLHVDSSDIQMARIHAIQESNLGLNGVLQVNTDVAGNLDLQNKQMPVQLTNLNTNFHGRSMQLNGQDLGSLNLQAQTRGTQVALHLDSDLAKTSLQGNGSVGLASGYPADFKLYFSKIRYSNLQPLLSAAGSSGSTRSSFDATVDGLVTVQGPLTQTDRLRGALTLNQVSLLSTAARGTDSQGPVTLLQNQNPIVVELDRNHVLLRNAHLTGRSTDISAEGSASLVPTEPLNFKLNASTDLALLQELDRDIYSSGNITAQINVGGTIKQPVPNGRIELKNASVNIADAPNGLSNANGVIQLNGNSATIRNLTAESGGGKIAVNGFAGLTGSTVRYNLRATANRVRTRYSGASLINSANLTLSGTTDRSLLSGTVTVDRITLGSQSDTGSLLSSTAAPPETPSAPSGPLAGMRLDIHVVTSSALSVQTSVSQNLSADADLTVRGTATNPSVLGRVAVTQGNLVFFGNRYTVNRALVNFYNPIKIEPVLDVDLETTVQGVDVTLGVTGTVENMKLNYRSDPPLRFDEIVALLATGKTPTSDPTIAAHQPVAPDQSLTQMGESAIVSQAVAAPLASRIQRVFGVNQLKIDPTFTSGSSLPQARVTLQQQISPTILFTYTTDLTQTTSQIIRVEWAFTPRFSAVASRNENGIVSVDFFWKKQLR